MAPPKLEWRIAGDALRVVVGGVKKLKRGFVTVRRIAMRLGNVFAKEVYIRLSGDEEFTCTTRYAGFRLWARHFRCVQLPCIPSRIEQWEPGPSVRQTDRHIGNRRLFED
jgi:hypothetical protein